MTNSNGFFITKKQKQLMKLRRHKKKLAEASSGGTREKKELEIATGTNKSSDSKKRPRQEETKDTKADSIGTATQNSTNNIVVVPKSLSSREAKKFRKNERRKAKANGLDETKLEFIAEGEDMPNPKKKQRKFPNINELVRQQQQQEHKTVPSQTASNNNNNDILPQINTDQYVALDCEMVGIGSSGKQSVLARVSLVNWNLDVLLDAFVKVPTRVTDFRTFVSGVTPHHLKSRAALEPAECRQQVASILKEKILVGHALSNDLKALFLTHPKSQIRDTAKYRPFQKLIHGKYKPRKLRDLVQEHLKVEIQKKGESHDSVDDAKYTMELFKTVQQVWERELELQTIKKQTKK